MRIKTFEISPMGKPRMTRRDKWAERTCVMSYRAYKDAIAYQRKGFQLADEFTVCFKLPMPKSWSKKKQRDMEGKPHQQKPDIDNLLKGLMDALMKNDETVYQVRAEKYWSRSGQIWIMQDNSKMNSTFQNEKERS